jgi:serine/threonine-protein kinase RsbW
MTSRRTKKPNALCRQLASRLEAVDAVAEEIRSFLLDHDLGADVFVVELLAREALNNAILHGNRNQAGKSVRFSLRLGRRWLRLEVTDEGSGFNWRTAQPGAPVVSATGGRGLFINARFADRVTFNQRGNQITLWLDISSTAKRYQHG